MSKFVLYSTLSCLGLSHVKRFRYTNSDFDRTIYKDCFKDKKWGVLSYKISPKIFAQSLCLDLKQTCYDHHMPRNHLKKVREDEEYSKNKIIQKDCKEKISYTFVTESKNLSKPQNNQHKPYRGFEK